MCGSHAGPSFLGLAIIRIRNLNFTARSVPPIGVKPRELQLKREYTEFQVGTLNLNITKPLSALDVIG
jgi:hypothetical protein